VDYYNTGELKMKKLLTSTAVTTMFAAVAFSSSGAMAQFPYFPHPFEDPWFCTSLCTDDPDLRQAMSGLQEALNTINYINDATAIDQTAINAANLISLEGLGDLGTVDQTGTATQNASNAISSNLNTDLEDITQAATNVLNSLTADDVTNVVQNVYNGQDASNYISFGWGGYVGTADAEDATQAAVNASNLITIATLHNEIKQASEGSQTAANLAEFVGPQPVYPNFWDFGIANVSNLTQEATNVTNTLTLEAVDLNHCKCGYEVDQYADIAQSATNDLVGKDGYSNINDIVQKATNVANSISMPSVDAP
jgi:hypothetical protein